MSLLDTFKKTTFAAATTVALTFGAAANAATEQEVRDLSSDCKTPVVWYGDKIDAEMAAEEAEFYTEKGKRLLIRPGNPSGYSNILVCGGISTKTYKDDWASNATQKAIAAQESVAKILSGERLYESNLQNYEKSYPGIQVREKALNAQASTNNDQPNILAANMQPQ